MRSIVLLVLTMLPLLGCTRKATNEIDRSNYAWETTVAEELAHNVHVHDGVSEEEFVKMRTARDATLAAPTLLLPSIQVNMRAGQLPPADANGVHYLLVPVTVMNEA